VDDSEDASEIGAARSSNATLSIAILSRAASQSAAARCSSEKSPSVRIPTRDGDAVILRFTRYRVKTVSPGPPAPAGFLSFGRNMFA